MLRVRVAAVCLMSCVWCTALPRTELTDPTSQLPAHSLPTRSSGQRAEMVRHCRQSDNMHETRLPAQLGLPPPRYERAQGEGPMSAPASMGVMELLRLEGIDPEKRAVVSREELRVVLEALAVSLWRGPAGRRGPAHPVVAPEQSALVRRTAWGEPSRPLTGVCRARMQAANTQHISEDCAPEQRSGGSLARRATLCVLGALARARASLGRLSGLRVSRGWLGSSSQT